MQDVDQFTIDTTTNVSAAVVHFQEGAAGAQVIGGSTDSAYNDFVTFDNELRLDSGGCGGSREQLCGE